MSNIILNMGNLLNKANLSQQKYTKIEDPEKTQFLERMYNGFVSKCDHKDMADFFKKAIQKLRFVKIISKLEEHM